MNMDKIEIEFEFKIPKTFKDNVKLVEIFTSNDWARGVKMEFNQN